MKAAVFERYGSPDVVHIQEVDKPSPKDNEILIRVRATTVTSGDARLRSSNFPGGFWLPARLGLGLFRPREKILGSEFSGDVETVGKAVTAFKPGEAVLGGAFGAHAECVCAPERAVAPKPGNLSYEEAAALTFGGITALAFLKDRAKIQAGEKLLIIGASGSVGTAAVQIAKHFGAEVTGVCSAASAELVRSLGADKIIDYATEDFTRNGERYDIIMDTVGGATLARLKDSLTPNGRLLLIVGDLGQLLFPSRIGDKRAIAGVAGVKNENLRLLAELAEAGKFKPVIDSVYPFTDIVSAHARVDTGRKRGNVVVTLP
jgi:NADPH:quinone reductase-like Zn-dependent oxidoreductase